MDLIWALSNITPSAIIDILLVALVFYGLSFLIRSTQSGALLRGLVLAVVLAIVAANLFELPALRWLVQNGLAALVVAIPVIFQPELRRAFERLGRTEMLFSDRREYDSVRAKVIDDICQAAERLSERRHGALIVLERSVSLTEYVRTGVPLDGEVSPQLLLTVFWPKTELHDGAAIISDDGRIAAAAAVLPLSSARQLGTPKLGTRHRAAIGISEVSDAICVVVSEETGRISIANAGRLITKLDSSRLRTILKAFYGKENERQNNVFRRLGSQIGLLGSNSRTPEHIEMG